MAWFGKGRGDGTSRSWWRRRGGPEEPLPDDGSRGLDRRRELELRAARPEGEAGAPEPAEGQAAPEALPLPSEPIEITLAGPERIPTVEEIEQKLEEEVVEINASELSDREKNRALKGAKKRAKQAHSERKRALRRAHGCPPPLPLYLLLFVFVVGVLTAALWRYVLRQYYVHVVRTATSVQAPQVQKGIAFFGTDEPGAALEPLFEIVRKRKELKEGPTPSLEATSTPKGEPVLLDLGEPSDAARMAAAIAIGRQFEHYSPYILPDEELMRTLGWLAMYKEGQSDLEKEATRRRRAELWAEVQRRQAAAEKVALGEALPPGTYRPAPTPAGTPRASGRPAGGTRTTITEAELDPKWYDYQTQVLLRLCDERLYVESVEEYKLNLRAGELPAVRRAVARGLGLSRRQSVPFLIEPLTDDNDASVRREVAWALGRIRSTEAVRLLFIMLADEDPGVSAEAERGLTIDMAVSPESVHLLLDLWISAESLGFNPRVSAKAKALLDAIRPQVRAEEMARYLTYVDNRASDTEPFFWEPVSPIKKRYYAVAVLRARVGPEMAPRAMLLDVLGRDKYPLMRVAAIGGLVDHYALEAIPVLEVRAERDADPGVRDAAQKALTFLRAHSRQAVGK